LALEQGEIPLSAPKQACHEREHCEYDKDKEQYLGNAHSAGSDATKAEQGGDERNDKKDNGVVQHFLAPVSVSRCD
jgi:hypothetical protein